MIVVENIVDRPNQNCTKNMDIRNLRDDFDIWLRRFFRRPVNPCVTQYLGKYRGIGPTCETEDDLGECIVKFGVHSIRLNVSTDSGVRHIIYDDVEYKIQLDDEEYITFDIFCGGEEGPSVMFTKPTYEVNHYNTSNNVHIKKNGIGLILHTRGESDNLSPFIFAKKYLELDTLIDESMIKGVSRFRTKRNLTDPNAK